MTIYRIIILILLFILLFIPNQGKEYFSIAGLIGLFSFFLLPIFIKNVRQDILHKNLTTIFFILFLVVLTVSTFFSIDRGRSVIQLLLFVSYFIIFTSIRSVFASHKGKELFAIFYLLFAIVLSFISLYNTFILHYVNRAQEGTSFMWIYFGHNHLSGILIFAIPLAFYFLWENWRNKFIRLILLLVTCCLLLVMFSTLARVSLLSLFISLFIGSFFLPIAAMKKSLIASFVGVMLIFFVLPFGISSKTAKLAVPKRKIDVTVQTNRVLYWNQAVTNFTLHPLFGTGLDTFRKVNSNSAFPQKPTSLRSDYAHNFFLQMLSDAGIFGFLTSLGLIFIILSHSVQKILVKSHSVLSDKFLSIAFFIGIFASTLNTLFDYDWQLPTIFLLFWINAEFIINSKT